MDGCGEEDEKGRVFGRVIGWEKANKLDGEMDGAQKLAGRLGGAWSLYWQGDSTGAKKDEILAGNVSGGYVFGGEAGRARLIGRNT